MNSRRATHKAYALQNEGNTMSKTAKVTDVTETASDVVEVSLSDPRFKNIARLEDQLFEGIVNPIVLAKACGVRPQMIYNYIRKGKIVAVKHNNTQKMVIERAEAERFLSVYLSRQMRREAKIAAQLAGE